MSTTAAVSEHALGTTISYICCGRRLSYVAALAGPGSRLSFTHCSGCESTRWYRGHALVDRADALELPASQPVGSGAGQGG